jgi:hypothetical protein
MLDRLNEWIELFLVGLGQALSRLSADEKKMISLLLVFLLVAAAAARALQMVHW